MEDTIEEEGKNLQNHTNKVQFSLFCLVGWVCLICLVCYVCGGMFDLVGFV